MSDADPQPAEPSTPSAEAATPHADPSDRESSGEADALLSRLRVIEDQPLATRAEALGHVHDELRGLLEAGEARTSG